MARSTTSAPAERNSGNRKRSHEIDLPNEPSKRGRKAPERSARLFNREGSPSKNVHFSRNLILGPFESDPNRRSMSPMRPALHRREDAVESPSTQLQAEQDAAQSGGARKKKRDLQTQMKAQTRKKGRRPPPANSLDVDTIISASDSSDEMPAGSHDHVCEQMETLKSKAHDFAESFHEDPRPDALPSLLKPENKQLIRFIGCLAMGGKDGREGWQALLSNGRCRRALVLGIIGRVLKEKVFDELCFGSDAQLSEILSKKEQDHVQQDGFFRTRQRADAILKHEKISITASTVQSAVARLTAQLERILLPLWKQGGTAATWKSSRKRQELATMIEFAAQLSRNMRKDRDTVYYWPPTFKDEEFQPDRMECLNMYDMIRDSPYDKKTTARGYERAVIRPGRESENAAIVRVVCFPGLVAYQQGGGELAPQELDEDEYERGIAPPDVQHRRRLFARKRGEEASTGNEGFRTKVLCKSVVLLQWGEQRRLTKEAGTSAHINAMKSGGEIYEKDFEGFVELYDLFLEETSRMESSLRHDESTSPHQSWLPRVSRLFSRSPSVQPEMPSE